MAFDIAQELDTALQTYSHVPGLVDHVRRACGADPGGAIAGQVVIRAYVIRTNDEVFSVYVLTESSFVVAEMARSGDTLAVWVDTLRISRVSELCTSVERTVIIEIDADVQRVVEEHETAGAGEENGSWLERGNSVARIIPASYEIKGPVEDQQLAWFILQARRNA